MNNIVDKPKMCSLCDKAAIFGWHAVKITCGKTGKEMCGYTGKDEYRVNAKDCPDFNFHGKEAWSDELQKLIPIENINWV